MAFLNVANNAESTLAGGITADAVSLTVATGGGAKFPSENFHITIEDEILKCTSRSGDVFSVARAQEGTQAAAHNAGAKVQLRLTAAIITELQEAIGSLQEDVSELQDLASLIPSTLTKVYLNTTQEDIASSGNPRVEFDTIKIDQGNNFQMDDWYGSENNYRQADSDSDATHIRDDDANFPAAILGARVRWASNAQGTQNTGIGYVIANPSADELPILKTAGADFGSSYYYWIKKAQYVAPVSGIYVCLFQIQYLSGVEADKRYGIYVFVNGVQTVCALFHASVDKMMRLPHNGVLVLNQGDIVSMHGYAQESPNATVDIGGGEGNTTMSIYCLRAL